MYRIAPSSMSSCMASSLSVVNCSVSAIHVWISAGLLQYLWNAYRLSPFDSKFTRGSSVKHNHPARDLASSYYTRLLGFAIQVSTYTVVLLKGKREAYISVGKVYWTKWCPFIFRLFYTDPIFVEIPVPSVMTSTLWVFLEVQIVDALLSDSDSSTGNESHKSPLHEQKNNKKEVGFEALTAVSTKIAVSWVVVPCSLEKVTSFRGPCCLHHQGDESWWWRQQGLLKRW
jgi:hypothetical protein